MIRQTVPVVVIILLRNLQDFSALEKLVEEDKASAKTPVLVIAYAGTPLTGHVDDIDKINEICRENNMWVHIEGYVFLCELLVFKEPSKTLQVLGKLGMANLGKL